MRAGYDLLFLTQSQLLNHLKNGRALGSYQKRLQELARVGVLVLDDYGLKPLQTPQDEDIHDLIAERNEQLGRSLSRVPRLRSVASRR